MRADKQLPKANAGLKHPQFNTYNNTPHFVRTDAGPQGAF